MPQDRLVTNTYAHEQLAAIKANDERILKALYLQNFPKIEALILSNNGTSDQAKDIYQEAFIALWRNIQLDKFHPESESAINGYLYQIARNKWMDQLRSAHHQKVVPMREERFSDLKDDTISDTERDYLDKIKINITKLGDNCKEVLTRFYYRKENMKTIAEAFGWTEASAKNNKYRCLEKLRAMVKS